MSIVTVCDRTVPRRWEDMELMGSRDEDVCKTGTSGNDSYPRPTL